MKTTQNKPFKSMNGKVFTATAQQLREEVFAEINEHKVSIDRTPQFEQEEIRQAKKAWKKDNHRDPAVLDAILEAGKRRPRANWKVLIDKTIMS